MATWNLGVAGPATLQLVVNQASQSVSGNYSIDNWQLNLFCSNGASWTNTPVPVSVIINGHEYDGNATFDFRGTGGVTLLSGSTQVAHNSDGTKSTDVKGGMGNTGTVIGPGNIHETLVQSTIPRASTPSFASGAVIIGNAHTLNTNRASSSFTHNITYTFGSASGTIGTGVGASVSWTPPLSLLTQIPNSTTGTGTITCVTKSGSTTIGTKSVAFTLTADTDVVPSFTSITCTEHNTAVATGVGAFVQKNSQLDVAIVGAAGDGGSTITGYKIVVDSQTINAVSGTTGLINSSGTIPVTATVTDSRGRTFTDNISIVVLPYAPPTLTSYAFARTDVSGSPVEDGTYVTLTLTAAVQSLIPASTEKNALSYRISSRDHTVGGAYTVDDTQTPGGITVTGATDTVGTFDIEDSFDFIVEVIDIFATTVGASTVPTGIIFMHWDGKAGIGVLKYRENGVVDVNGDVYVSGALHLGQHALITDWNSAITPGLFYGVSASNSPATVDGAGGTVFTGRVQWSNVSGTSKLIQTLQEMRTAVYTIEYERYWNGTTWSAWIVSSGTYTTTIATTFGGAVLNVTLTRQGQFAHVYGTAVPTSAKSLTPGLTIVTLGTAWASAQLEYTYVASATNLVYEVDVDGNLKSAQTITWPSGSRLVLNTDYILAY